MSQQPVPSEVDPADEELVAYLDGELNAGDRAQLERRLADDEAFRTRLRLLQRTWDALDVLGRADVGEQFTRTTVELVAVKAAEDVVREKTRQIAHRNWAWLGWTAVALAAGAFGWLLLSVIHDLPNQQLLRDLRVIQRVDEYRNADSIEYVRALVESGLFAAELESPISTASAAAGGVGELPEGAEEIARLKPEEKARLQQRSERFEALSPAEQDRLRKLHEQISGAAKAPELLAVLDRYSQWLRTLTPQQQASLVGLSIEDRLAKIKEIQQIQVQAHYWRLAGRLEKDDLDLIYAWMEDLVWQHQDAILARVDPDWAVRVYSTLDPSARRRMLLGRVFGQRGTQVSALLPAAAAEDFALLAARLPASLQEQLAAQRTDEDRRDLIITCAKLAWWTRNSPHMPPPPSDEELREFFATLDPAEVEEVEQLDPQQMRRELIRRYQFKRLREGRGRPFEGSGFGSSRGEAGSKRGVGQRPAIDRRPSGSGATKTGGEESRSPPDAS